MRNVVFQVSIAPKGREWKTAGKKVFRYSNHLYDFSNVRAKQYADRVGADYFRLKTMDWLGEEYAPCYHKLYLYELAKKYDRILYLDSDCIITKFCPDIFKKENEVWAAVDQSNTPSGRKQLRLLREKHSISNHAHLYFTTSVQHVNKEFCNLTAEHWRKEIVDCENLAGSQHDQSVFNMLVAKHHHYRPLNPSWGAWYGNGYYIKHYYGPTNTSNWEPKTFLDWENRLQRKLETNSEH